MSEYRKPEWALVMELYQAMESSAIEGQERAMAIRCPAEESGGQQCTADAYPQHAHRFELRDIPGHST